VPRLNANQGNTLRTLDYQSVDIEESTQRSSCISLIFKEEAEAMARNDVDIHKERSDQVSPEFHAFKVVCILAGSS
jgi:hypothetical protein